MRRGSTPVGLLAAELRKLTTLPAVRAGVAVSVLGSAALTVLNAVTVRQAITAGRPDLLADTSPFETAFASMPIGTVGAVVVGVVAIGSEYTANGPDTGGGRQITATLAAAPHRARLLAVKAGAVVLAVVAAAAVSIPASTLVARVLVGAAGTETVPVGDQVARSLGGATYWTLTALIAFAITVLTRSGTVPLLVLIPNSSVVSVPLLLTTLTDLAYWLPDLAGRRLFTGVDTVGGGLGTVPGALVMAGWAAVLLVVAGVVFSRRDA